MMKEIERQRKRGIPWEGSYRVVAKNIPVGLEFTNWDRKIDAKIAKSIIVYQVLRNRIWIRL